MRRQSVLLGLVLLPLVAGCGDSLAVPGIAVSGRVTYQGKPLPKGTIAFRADFFTGGRSAVADINDGWYSLSRTEGPSEGTFGVEILTAPYIAKGFQAPVGVESESIPAKYNYETELRVVLHKRRWIELMFDLE